MSKAKRWVFTLNNPAEADTIDPSLVEYAIIGREVAPTTNTPHLQGFACFVKRMTLSQLSKLLPRAHWAVARGSVDDNIRYCSKEGQFNEIGKRPSEQTGNATQKRKADYAAAIDLAKRQKLYDVEPELLLRFGSSLRAIQRDHPASLLDNDFLCGVWLVGPPGSGKSRTARWLYPGSYPKPLNKWWDGYQGEPYVILDDLEPDHRCLGHHLKIWADHYPFTAEQKGTSIRIRPQVVCVTSNYQIHEVFSDHRMVEAMERRFTIYRFNADGTVVKQ